LTDRAQTEAFRQSPTPLRGSHPLDCPLSARKLAFGFASLVGASLTPFKNNKLKYLKGENAREKSSRNVNNACFNEQALDFSKPSKSPDLFLCPYALVF
jgi:hypothetical protein